MTAVFDRLPPALDPRRRLRRQSYLIFHIVMLTAGFVLPLLAGALAPVLLPALPDNPEDSPLLLAIGAVVGLALTLLELTVLARRCHDAGWTGWLSLIALLPYIGFAFIILMLFVPGSKGDNRYGPDPREADAQPA